VIFEVAALDAQLSVKTTVASSSNSTVRSIFGQGPVLTGTIASVGSLSEPK
jgi:hypothetical protein